MLKRRFSTRGHSIFAAMLLASFLGAAAIALDAQSMHRNPYGLTAFAVMAEKDSYATLTATLQETLPSESRSEPMLLAQATQLSPENSVNRALADPTSAKCEAGVKYNIQTKDGKPEIVCSVTHQCNGSPITAQGCTNGAEVLSTLSVKPKLQCTTSNNLGEIYYCLNRELTSRDQVVCSKVKNCVPGAGIDTSQVKKEAEPALVKKEIERATPERQQQILNALKTDPATQKALNAAFAADQLSTAGQISSIEQNMDGLRERQADLEAKLGALSCGFGGRATWCEAERSELQRVKDELSKEQQQLSKLQQDSQRLAGLTKTLQPQNVPAGSGGCKSNEPDCQDYNVAPEAQRPSCNPNTDKNCYGHPTPDSSTFVNCADTRFSTHPSCISDRNPAPDRRDSRDSGLGNPNALSSLLRGLTGGGQGGQSGSGQRRCSTISSLFGCEENPKPSCTLNAQPQNINPQVSGIVSGNQSQLTQPQQVTLTWQTQNASSAYLSNAGTVGPNGSMNVQVQSPTTYTMTVYNRQGEQVTCSTSVTVGNQGSGGSNTPTAQISCEPKLVDPGMKVAISYACQNSASSTAVGFSTGGNLSGSTEVTVEAPSGNVSSLTYSLTCGKASVSNSAQCSVQLNKPTIVMVATPKKVRSGQETSVGWVTSGMESCVISSPTLSVFTAENESRTNPSGVTKTPQLTTDTEFVLNCTTRAGGVRSARVTVEIDNTLTSWVGTTLARLF